MTPSYSALEHAIPQLTDREQARLATIEHFHDFRSHWRAMGGLTWRLGSEGNLVHPTETLVECLPLPGRKVWQEFCARNRFRRSSSA